MASPRRPGVRPVLLQRYGMLCRVATKNRRRYRPTGSLCTTSQGQQRAAPLSRQGLGSAWARNDSAPAVPSKNGALPSNCAPLMCKERQLHLFGRKVTGISLSNLMGHLSFVMLGLGYMETDVLPLRLYAATGITSGILFQYFRAQPLWIPISWNTVFLAINAVMIGVLVKDRRDAANVDKETGELYQEVFQKMGLTQVEFMHLMAQAQRTELPIGHHLTREHHVQDKLYLLLSGELKVMQGDEVIDTIGPINCHHFVGEVSFVSHMNRCENGEGTKGRRMTHVLLRQPSVEPDAAKPTSPDSKGGEEQAGEEAEEERPCTCTATASVVSTRPAKVYLWEFDVLRDFLYEHPTVSHAMQAAISHDLADRMANTKIRSPVAKYRQLVQGVMMDDIVTDTEKRHLELLGKSLGITLEEQAHVLRAAGWTPEEYKQGYKRQEKRVKYEQLLSEALRGGVLTKSWRRRLRQYREEQGIRAMEHLKILTKLGWTMDEYEAGQQSRTPQQQAEAQLTWRRISGLLGWSR